MRAFAVAVAFFLVLSVQLTAAAEPQQREVNLLSMGDWGHSSKNQPIVAKTLADYVRAAREQGRRQYDAMLLAGDNFYVRLDDGVRDDKWRTMFEEMYDPRILDFPFYVALGNHDYEHDRFMVQYAYAVANPESRWKMPGRYYRVNFPSDEEPVVSVLVLDSVQPFMGELGWRDQLRWLEAEAAKPRVAPWVIAVAHHPFVSNGSHGDNGALQKAWAPHFAKLGVDFYVCGHDHDLQHLEVQEFPHSFLLVGGGGATTRPMRIDRRGPFSRAVHGFADLTFTPELATVRLVESPGGQTLHEFTRARDGTIQVLRSSPSDVATPRTVRSITRPDTATPAPAVQPAPARVPAPVPAR